MNSMGTRRSMICPVCNYEAFTSAGPDRGFRIWTNTYCCADCNALVDLVLENGNFGVGGKGEKETEKIRDGQKCKNCEGTNFLRWDSKNKPCPNCGTQLEINPDGMKMNWD